MRDTKKMQIEMKQLEKISYAGIRYITMLDIEWVCSLVELCERCL